MKATVLETPAQLELWARLNRYTPIAIAIVLASVSGQSALADDLKYVGMTTQTFDGASGYFAPHRACGDEFQGAVWCTSEMIIENGPHGSAPIPQETEVAWVNPVFVGVGLGWDETHQTETREFLEFSGQSSFISTPFNCSGWVSNVRGRSFGLVLLQDAKLDTAEFRREDCSIRLPAACCGGRPKLQVGGFVAPSP